MKHFKHLMILSSCLWLLGCSASSDDTETVVASSVNISGVLNGSSLSGKASLSPSSLEVSAVSSVSDLELYGLAFSNPPEAQVVAVGSDGSFSLSFSSAAAGSTISLIFRDKTDPSNEVGVVKFVDNTKVGIDGNAKSSSSIPLSGTVSLGTLALNSNGEVVVDVSTITTGVTEATVSASTAFDFTGNWVFSSAASAGITIPSGYRDICAAGDESCDGPQDNMPIYLKRISGKSFTPDATCSAAVTNDTFSGTCGGTAGTEDRFAIMVWSSSDALTNCGSKLGFTHDEAKAYGRVDFSGDTSLASGAFDWTAGWTDGWKNASATATYDQKNCTSVPDPTGSGEPGWKCTDTSGNYHIGLGGGCYETGDSTQTSLHIKDWSGITNGSCTDTSSGLPTGYSSESCNYTGVDHDGDGSTAAINITCNHTGGAFDSSNNPINNFDYNNVTTIVSQGAACSSINPATSDAHALAQLRCYADYYWQNAESAGNNACLQKLRTNWEAQTADDFIVKNDGPSETENQFVMSFFEYTGTESGFFQDNEIYSEGVQSGNSWISCKLAEDFKMSLRPITAGNPNSMIVEFESKTRLLDTDKPECVAAAADSSSRISVGVSKYIMALTKQ